MTVIIGLKESYQLVNSNTHLSFREAAPLIACWLDEMRRVLVLESKNKNVGRCGGLVINY